MPRLTRLIGVAERLRLLGISRAEFLGFIHLGGAGVFGVFRSVLDPVLQGLGKIARRKILREAVGVEIIISHNLVLRKCFRGW